MTRRILPIILCASLVACSTERPATERPAEAPLPNAESELTARTYGFSVVRTLPHDVKAFTQGLVVHKGAFLESTGQNGQSSIRIVDISTGKVRKLEKLDERYFGEGMTVLNGKAYMITWLNQTGFIYDAATLKKLDMFSYAGEGWGLTNDGTNLIMSNGSNVLSVIDPQTFAVVRSISVTQSGSLVSQLNELEWIDGEIWANIWQSDRIVHIDPATGRVTGVVDLTGILPNSSRDNTTDVLNGIAYDSASKSIYVTGKNWPSMFQIKIQ